MEKEKVVFVVSCYTTKKKKFAFLRKKKSYMEYSSPVAAFNDRESADAFAAKENFKCFIEQNQNFFYSPFGKPFFSVCAIPLKGFEPSVCCCSCDTVSGSIKEKGKK